MLRRPRRPERAVEPLRTVRRLGLLAHLRVLEGVVNQPFAALLFFATGLVFGVSVAEAVAPRERWRRFLVWVEPVEGYLAAGFLALMALSWAYKSWLMGPV